MFILGPLTYTKNGTTTVYGVVSGPAFYKPKEQCNKLGIYIRVSAPEVLYWIHRILKSGRSARCATNTNVQWPPTCQMFNECWRNQP